jgi:hypothetical protein
VRTFIGILLRLFSYLFHLGLSAFLLGIAVIAASSHQALALGMLPFSEEQMVSRVAMLGAIGLLATLLALFHVFRYLFPLWAGLVLYLMVNGFLFSPYSFAGPDAFKSGLWLIFAALLAFIGALWVLKPRRGRLYV